jgi:hypothetical protein
MRWMAGVALALLLTGCSVRRRRPRDHAPACWPVVVEPIAVHLRPRATTTLYLPGTGGPRRSR